MLTFDSICAISSSPIRCTFAEALTISHAARLFATSVLMDTVLSDATVQSQSPQLDSDRSGLMPAPRIVATRRHGPPGCDR